MRYLEDLMMAEKTIPFANFRSYLGNFDSAFINTNTNMILDSQT